MIALLRCRLGSSPTCASWYRSLASPVMVWTDPSGGLFSRVSFRRVETCGIRRTQNVGEWYLRYEYWIYFIFIYS